MKNRLAAGFSFQKTVVQHPFCRYTILPAGVVLAIWAVMLPCCLVSWRRLGGEEAYDITDAIARLRWDTGCQGLAIVAVVVVAVLLTNHLKPILLGLLVVFLACSLYEHGDAMFIDNASMSAFLFHRLVFFAPACLWLCYLDRQSGKWPALPFWMKALAVVAAMVLAGLVLGAFAVADCWLKTALLLPPAAAFGFTVFFDLAWRMSPDLPGQLRSLLLAWGIILLGWFLLLAYWLSGGLYK